MSAWEEEGSAIGLYYGGSVTGEPAAMGGGFVLQRLSEAECHQYLAQTSLGRLALTANALPAIRAVRFSVAAGQVVIRCHPKSVLCRAAGSVVAFQADHASEDGTGWSVHLVGVCQALTDPHDLSELRKLPLPNWSQPPDRDVFIGLPLTGMRGERILRAAQGRRSVRTE